MASPAAAILPTGVPVSPSGAYLGHAAVTSPAVAAQLMQPPVHSIPAAAAAAAHPRAWSPLWRWLGWAVALGLSAHFTYSLLVHLRAERRRRRVANQLELLLGRGGASLKHSYFMVRHGESTANVAGIVSSDPAIATVTHGLTEVGRAQVAEAASEWYKQLPLHQPIVILSSDFLRARETAEVVKETLLKHRLRVGLPTTAAFNTIHLEPRLRERFFGAHEGQTNTAYDLIWHADAVSADHVEQNVESVNHVVRRTTKLIVDTESQLHRIDQGGALSAAAAATFSALHSAASSSSSSSPSCSVILVAHGDVCQILASAFAGLDPRLHRSLPHWKNGEMRQLKWQPSASTEAV